MLGLRTHLAPIRRAGLALLGLATAKVFIVDLAALDVAYRVLSLVGLGVLLLVSALVYARLAAARGAGRSRDLIRASAAAPSVSTTAGSIAGAAGRPRYTRRRWTST